jgi:hypothetical protein
MTTKMTRAGPWSMIMNYGVRSFLTSTTSWEVADPQQTNSTAAFMPSTRITFAHLSVDVGAGLDGRHPRYAP